MRVLEHLELVEGQLERGEQPQRAAHDQQDRERDGPPGLLLERDGRSRLLLDHGREYSTVRHPSRGRTLRSIACDNASRSPCTRIGGRMLRQVRTERTDIPGGPGTALVPPRASERTGVRTTDLRRSRRRGARAGERDRPRSPEGGAEAPPHPREECTRDGGVRRQPDDRRAGRSGGARGGAEAPPPGLAAAAGEQRGLRAPRGRRPPAGRGQRIRGAVGSRCHRRAPIRRRPASTSRSSPT